MDRSAPVRSRQRTWFGQEGKAPTDTPRPLRRISMLIDMVDEVYPKILSNAHTTTGYFSSDPGGRLPL